MWFILDSCHGIFYSENLQQDYDSSNYARVLRLRDMLGVPWALGGDGGEVPRQGMVSCRSMLSTVHDL
jgi:hypothetical protein